MLQLDNLCCRYGAVTAVDSVDLTLASGEFVSLLGPSGCGKTTTLRMIAGFIDPSGGSITLDGQVISSATASLPPEKRGMAMIFQSYAIWPNMTVAENVAFGLGLRKLPKSEIRQRVGAMLDLVKLGGLADRYPSELSGGQQQRVALARAMVVRPAVLLLDEPLSNLDANLREEMRFEIRRLHDEFKITTVYVTHDQSEAMATSDRIAVMNRGRIEQIADPFTLYNHPRTRFVAGFIGRSNFLEGIRTGDRIDFGGFAVDGRLFPETQEGKSLTYSLRPQSLALSAQPPSGDGLCAFEGTITQRTYLGESWDYAAAVPGTDLPLRISAAPSDRIEPGSSIWLSFDPASLSQLSER